MSGPAVEDRVSRLEAQVMWRRGIFDVLYDSYGGLQQSLIDAQRTLEERRNDELAALRAFKAAKALFEDGLAIALMNETGKGGRLTGGAADTRRLIREGLIAELKKGKLSLEWDAFQSAERVLDRATMEKDVALDEFSKIRYAARMTSGLAYALGG